MKTLEEIKEYLLSQGKIKKVRITKYKYGGHTLWGYRETKNYTLVKYSNVDKYYKRKDPIGCSIVINSIDLEREPEYYTKEHIDMMV